MKNYLAIMACLMLMLSLFACGQEEAAEPDPGAAGQAEEVADTTRLDSAVAEVIDSAAAVVEEAVEEAVDKAVEEVTGD